MIVLFKFLGFIVLFFIVLALIFVVIGFSFLRKMMGRRKNQNPYSSTYSSNGKSQDSYGSPDEKIGKVYAEKLFDKNEGEYVDFEDIPDKKQ